MRAAGLPVVGVLVFYEDPGTHSCSDGQDTFTECTDAPHAHPTTLGAAVGGGFAGSSAAGDAERGRGEDRWSNVGSW